MVNILDSTRIQKHSTGVAVSRNIKAVLLQVEWDSRYKLAKDDRELRMKTVRLDDSGRYQCQATNGFGHRTVDFTVHVYGRCAVVGSL